MHIYTTVQKFRALYLLDKNIDPLYNYFIENIKFYFRTYIIEIKFMKQYKLSYTFRKLVNKLIIVD